MKNKTLNSKTLRSKTPNSKLAPVNRSIVRNNSVRTGAAKRTVLYARVSSEEQTKGNYPSCESQVEEMEAECARRGFVIHDTVRDEGYSAGSLKRPGLSELRCMVRDNEIDAVMCTWYDRLTRSRDFYTLDNEFRGHHVELITLHDATDTATAAGRFMESMLVAAKTYDREQTAEKVRTKMRMRLEKGLHQGGLVPFGFLCDAETKLLTPDPESLGLLQQIFQVYVDTQSHFALKDWLKAHQITSPRGEKIWKVGTLRDLLSNRRYIGQIEINRRNKGIEGLPEEETYRIVPAAYEPMIAPELFTMAQAIQKEKALSSPNRRGRAHSYSQNRCNRIFLLQNRLVCGVCGASMTPYYVVHKPGKHRKNESYIHYYICANQHMNGRGESGHSNRVLARVSESWILDKVAQLATAPEILEQAFVAAQQECQADLQPQHEALAMTRRALEENQLQLDKLVDTITSGQISATLISVLDEKAQSLKLERERLKTEQRRLESALLPLQDYFETIPLRETLAEFSALAPGVDKAKLQKLIRLSIKRIEWLPDGEHAVEFYQMPKWRRNGSAAPLETWLESNEWSDTPGRIRTSNQGIMSPLL